MCSIKVLIMKFQAFAKSVHKINSYLKEEGRKTRQKAVKNEPCYIFYTILTHFYPFFYMLPLALWKKMTNFAW